MIENVVVTIMEEGDDYRKKERVRITGTVTQQEEFLGIICRGCIYNPRNEGNNDADRRWEWKWGDGSFSHESEKDRVKMQCRDLIKNI